MTKQEFHEIEAFMAGYMNESIHNRDHIYRVLYAALTIAECEENVDMDILIAACLLHDIGREAQSKDLNLDHAEIGAKIAREYLLNRGWSPVAADHVSAAIRTHRFRRDEMPATLEAMILFDADKLDATGLMGIARTLGYGGLYGEPLYEFDAKDQLLLEGDGAEISTFLQEFNYKLRNVYDRFYTKTGAALASGRKDAAIQFYDRFVSEVLDIHESGVSTLNHVLHE